MEKLLICSLQMNDITISDEIQHQLNDGHLALLTQFGLLC